MIYELPTSIEVNGIDYKIRTDYRDILDIMVAFGDPDLEPEEKVYVCLYILYIDSGKIPNIDLEEAYEKAVLFLNCGVEQSKTKSKKRTMDWEQDAPLIFPAVNKVAGFEVRSVEYMHWWTFCGLFMEIKGTSYSTVLGIRNKKAEGKKLEQWEKDYWNANRETCVLKEKLTKEEKEEKERLLAILG